MLISLRSLICIIVLLNSTLYCAPVTYNDGDPRPLCQDFPLLNNHLPANKITTIANTEGNKSWWQKICRTPAYAACMEIECLLQDLYEAGNNFKNPDSSAKEPELAHFTEAILEQFVREKIAIILGSDYQAGVHKREYVAYMGVIIEGKKHFEELSDNRALTPKRRRTISISDNARPLWAYVLQ